MFTSAITQQAKEAEAAVLGLASAIDPDDIPASEAPGLFELLDRIVRSATAARTVMARRVGDAQEWRRRGYRSPAEMVAATTGSSLGAAKAEMETSEALRELPTTRREMLEGNLSPAQGQVIAGAATVNPDAERTLIDAAGTANLGELRDQAGRARAAADPDPEATHRRLHRNRRVSRHTDAEGALHLHAVGTADEASEILCELDRLTDEIFRERRSSGVREARDTYVWDALLRMARNSRDGSDRAARPTATNPRFLGLLRVDVEALRRGMVEGDELCEITGVGPVPVRVARDLLTEATLKLVITRGVDVCSVTSLGRGPTAAMRYATAWTTPTCTVEGCSRTIIEYDHRWGAEFKDTRRTCLGELDPVCPGHHDLHTHHGWALVPGQGKRPMVPPDDPRHPAHAVGSTGPPPAGPRLPTSAASGTTSPAAADSTVRVVPGSWTRRGWDP